MIAIAQHLQRYVYRFNTLDCSPAISCLTAWDMLEKNAKSLFYL